MPIVKNILRKAQNKPQGLDKIDVLVHEEGLTSQYFNIFDFSDNLPKGSSSFLIDGSDLLKDEVQLKVEIIDSAGNVVFTTPIPNYLEGTSRRISIEIYDDVAPGPAFLYIVGELDPTRTNVPQSFKDVYNVRYKRPIYINTSIVNTEPIIFYGQPTINVSEIVKGHIDDVRATSVTTISTITGSVALEVKSGVSPVTIPAETADDYFSDIEDRTSVGFESEIFSKRPKNKKDAIRGKGLGKGGGKGKPTKSDESWTLNVFEMEKGADNSLDKITSDLIGAEITFTRPDLLIDSEKFPSNEYTIPTTFSTKISEVINNTTFRTKDAFKVTKNNGQKEFASIPASSSGVTIKYETFSEETTSETFFRSFADITVGNLRTFSGDVYKAKVFTKDNGTLGDFEEIYDNVVESQQVLVDTLSPTGFRDIGFFHTQSIIDNQWTTGSTTTVVTQDDEFLIDGALISGSNGALGVSDVFVTSQSFSLQNNVPYTLEFNTFFFKADKKDVDGNIFQQAKMNVYLTGSAITGTEEADCYLGEVDIPLNSNNQGKIENVFNTFNSSKTGAPATQVKFEVESGRFAIQDVKLRPYSQTNFNPDFFRALTPMPRPTRRGDNFDFLVKFYDANNNEAEVFAVTESIAFEGPPLVIDGTDNVISGSVFLGNVSGSGIELHGGSAYIRSIGYNGFDNTISNNLGGFMLFSGSVKDQVDSSETYEGVGLEIVDAHGDEDRFFKFKTNAEGTPSEFEIQTDTFFLGRNGQFISGSNNNIVISSSNFFLGDDNGAFISGSNGNLNISSSTFFLGGGSTFVSGSNNKLEISSSNFHLDNDGSVILQGQITATLGGIIGGFIIGSASLFTGAEATPNFFISGSATGTGFEKENLFISSSGFQVSGDGEMSASAGVIGGFNIVRDGLGSANDAFQVTGSSGKITGSDVLFDGGRIGGFDIVADGLSSINNAFQVTGSSGKITGSDVLFDGGVIGGFELGSTIISSSNDNLVLKSSGQITGSDVLFEGGTIGGFTITDSKIESSDFVSGLKGVRISTEQNGLIEAENARIRGTLSTTTFEKETINAVGGQLLVANSTMITGSSMGINDTSASVANVSGFTVGEVLMIKEVSSTGFNTEYLRVHSASRDSTDDNNLTGKLFVTRSFSNTTVAATGSEGFRGEAFGNSGSYEPGQVIVSTGRSGSGYIRLNANPNDLSTPYIDIVERTGSGIYDTELKARLGDLSGLSYSTIGTTTPGFGLFSENVFLTGTISATSGSIGGVKMHSNKLFVGTGTFGNDDTKFFVDENGDFSLGDKLVFDQSEGTLNIDATITIGSISGLASVTASNAALNDQSASVSASAASGQSGSNALNTQIVLSTAGMSLKNADTSKTLASYGATTKIFDGENNNTFVEVGGDGINIVSGSITGSAFGPATSSFFGTGSNKHDRLELVAEGLNVFKNNSKVATFGSTVRVGEIGNDKSRLEIDTDGNLSIINRQGSTDTTVVSLDKDGDGTFSGDLSAAGGTFSGQLVIGGSNTSLTSNAIAGALAANISGSSVSGSESATTTGDAGVANAKTAQDAVDVVESRVIITGNDVTVAHNSGQNRGIFNAAGLTIIGNNQTGSIFGNFGAEIYGASNKQDKVIVDSSGISILANNITGSSFTNATASIFGSSNKEERVEVVGDGLMIYDTNKAVAKFGATTAVGALEEAGSQLQIDSTGKLTVLSGSTTIFEVGTINISEPVISPDGRLAAGTATTQAVMSAPTMSAGLIDSSNVSVGSKFIQSITNIDSTNLSAFGFTESSSAEGNGNQPGNYKINHYSVHNPAEGRTSDSEPGFQFNYTHQSNVGNSVSMSRFTGGVFDLNVFIEPKSGSTLKPADKEFAALMINVDDDTAAAPSGDGYSFIHCKGSLTGSTALDKFQVSSSGDVIASGNITAFGTAFSSVSDRNWKKDIQTFSGSLDKLLELKPRKFKWKKDNKEDYGFIAQEVEEILPHIVRNQGFNKAGKGTGGEKHKTIDYSKLTPYLVDTIQELTKRIEKLEKKVS